MYIHIYIYIHTHFNLFIYIKSTLPKFSQVRWWWFSRYVLSDSCDPTECSLPGFTVLEIFQAKILGWVAVSFSRGSSKCRDRTNISWTTGRFFTAEPPGKAKCQQHWQVTGYILSTKTKIIEKSIFLKNLWFLSIYSLEYKPGR